MFVTCEKTLLCRLEAPFGPFLLNSHLIVWNLCLAGSRELFRTWAENEVLRGEEEDGSGLDKVQKKFFLADWLLTIFSESRVGLGELKTE